MRTLALLGLVLALLAATAIVSPAVFALLDAAGFRFAFGRVWNRVFEVLLVVAIALAWRRLDLGTPAQLGLARPHWRRELAVGLAVGLAGIGAGLLACWLGGALVPGLRFPGDPLKMLRKVASGLGAAAILGLLEELLFRAVLLRRLQLDCGRVAGAILTTALYAVVHALRPGGGEAGHATAGVARALALFAPLAEAAPWASVAALAGFGTVLVIARQATGSLWLPIGIHAAWVAVFRVGRLFFRVRPWPAWLVGPGWPPIVGGAAGWVAVVATAAALRVAMARLGRPAASSGR